MTDSEKLSKRFFQLTALNILTNLTVPLVGLVDTVMLGHLEDIRFLAGVALATVLFDYLYWSFGFLRMGSTGTTAQAFGREDTPEVYRVLYRFALVAVGVGLLLLVLQRPLEELGFLLLSGDPGVEGAGREYYTARIWGAPATLCNYVFLGWFLGRAESRHALVMTIAGNLANVVLNYVFIIRLQMAALGAGLATTLSQYLMLVVAVTLFLGLGRPARFRWAEVLDRERLKMLFRLNLDIMIRTFFLQTAFAVFINLSSLMGTAVLAANAIVLRLLHVAAYFIDGAAFASESLAGIFKGRRDPESFRRLVRLSLASGLGFAVALLIVLLPLPRLWYGLLTSHADIVDLAARYTYWLIPVLVFGSFAYMYDGIFLGLTAGRPLRNAMLVSTLLVFVPIALVGYALGNVHLLWAAMTMFMAVRAATLHVALRTAAAEVTAAG
ncbi:MAG: MATE family efflux transporter [Acidobacteriota bacterium]|nr:MATE family efflux transporter [Acidobacteriota bacterium]